MLCMLCSVFAAVVDLAVKHSSTCVHELLSLLPFSVGIHSFVDLNVPVFLGQYHTLLLMLVTLLLHIE